jgi:acyl-CoA reductase-like NAD-dependent aldehyde dehydrogenase
VIVDPDLNSELMTDEIFGPVLPIVSVNSVEEAIQFMYVYLYLLETFIDLADPAEYFRQFRPFF